MEPVVTIGAMTPLAIVAIAMGAIIAIPFAVFAVIYLIVPALKGLGWLIRQVAVFLWSTVTDILRFVGALITSVVLVPLTIGSVIIGRWSASAHYGRAIQSEFKNMGRAVYRVAIGNPARLLCLTPLTDGLERRIPEVMAAAPGSDRPSRRQGQFEGYQIVGSLPGGGSGGRLYVAKPDDKKLAAFARNGHVNVDHVVIKCFSQHDGTTLPQIVRENRALDAAKRLGLILEHDLNNERFYYAMRYVPGDSLNLVTQRLHAAAGSAGLSRGEFQEILAYAADLLRTLHTYHQGGLWHKDVKPDNVIVCDGQAHLVDFGLVTPLRSSMTLTTHGTEYFRDPEMVRMALKGVKVLDVDGAKFDIYAVGAVLFSMIENSFPAHGGLSQLSRSCPEAVRWIVRRAMTDYDKRYPTAAAMLADVEAVLSASDPFALRPAHLPSVAMTAEDDVPAAAARVADAAGVAGVGGMPPIPPVPPMPPIPPAAPAVAAVADGWSQYPGMNPNSPAHGTAAARTPSGRVVPDLRVTSWFRGEYEAKQGMNAGGFPGHGGVAAAAAAVGVAGVAGVAARGSSRNVHQARAAAAEQLRSARARAAAAQQRVRSRHTTRAKNYPSGINIGVAAALLAFFGVAALVIMGMFTLRTTQRIQVAHTVTGYTPELPVVIETGVLHPAHADIAISTPSETRVMVVCEWSKFDAERQSIIASQIENLHEAGFVLCGDFVPGLHSVTTASSNSDLEAVAQLRSTVGTRPFLSSDARDYMRSWMDSTHEADAIVWFAGMQPGQPNVPATAWMVGGTGVSGNVLETAQNALRSVE